MKFVTVLYFFGIFLKPRLCVFISSIPLFGVNAAAAACVFRRLSLSTLLTCSSSCECTGRRQGMCTAAVFVHDYKVVGRAHTLQIPYLLVVCAPLIYYCCSGEKSSARIFFVLCCTSPSACARVHSRQAWEDWHGRVAVRM